MTYAKPPITADDSITMSVKDFCRVSGIGPGLVYTMIKDGRLETFLVSPKYRLIVMDSYRRYVKQQGSSMPAQTKPEDSFFDGASRDCKGGYGRETGRARDGSAGPGLEPTAHPARPRPGCERKRCDYDGE
jgi:hypothetical protein